MITSAERAEYRDTLNYIATLMKPLEDHIVKGTPLDSNLALVLSKMADSDDPDTQMKALKIYAPTSSASHPCRALDLEKKENTMVLGEGAASFCLERGPVENPLAVIRGLGYATEILTHNISISSEALCFQKSMQMALEDACLQTVDAVVMHAPGTIKGDMSDADWHGNKLKQGIRELFQEVVAMGGTLSGEHGIGLVQKDYLDIAFSKTVMQLQQGIKGLLDPLNIMNPGKIFPDA